MEPTQGNGTKKTVRKLPVFENNYQLEKFLEQNFTESLKQMIKVSIQTMVKAEMEIFREQFEQRLHEKLYFNGYYGRNMISPMGKINDIAIPRFRKEINEMELKTMGVFDHEQEKFVQIIEQMHLMGVSQRKIADVARICFQIPVSKNRVGKIYKEFADQEEMQINNQILDDEYEYLMLDGIWEVTKGYGWSDNKSVLLCALGVKPDGTRKVLGFRLSRAEETKEWSVLVESLKSRGLRGGSLKLVIGDDHESIKNAAAIYYPGVAFQVCICHKMRNVLGKTGSKNKKSVAEDLKAIFASSSKDEALSKTKAVVKKWYMVEPKAMESLRFHSEYCFTYFEFPRELWTKIRTTNLLEREFREVRRRMKVFDNTFQNEQSANRYANTIMSYLNKNYPRYQLHTTT